MSWTARTESRTDAGSVNTGSYWRDRGHSETTVRSRSHPNHRQPRPIAAARLARDIDQSSPVASHGLPHLEGDLDQRSNIGVAGAEVDDAGPQEHAAVDGGGGDV